MPAAPSQWLKGSLKCTIDGSGHMMFKFEKGISVKKLSVTHSVTLVHLRRVNAYVQET